MLYNVYLHSDSLLWWLCISFCNYTPLFSTQMYIFSFYWQVLDRALDLERSLATQSLQITIQVTKGRLGQPEEGFSFLSFLSVVYVGRWDGITAQTKDPLGTVGCEAHMGKQAADELLTWASHHCLRERRGGMVGGGCSPQDLKDLHVLGALFGLGQDLGFKLLKQLSQSFILRFRDPT